MTLIEAAHFVRRRLWRWFRPATRGVKVLVLNERGEVLLIRNSYGDTAALVLPGGGIRPFERAEACARREVREETGCDISELTPIGEFLSSREGKRDSITLFVAQTRAAPVRGSREVVEAGFYPPTAPPSGTSPATLRRLAEFLGHSVKSSIW